MAEDVLENKRQAKESIKIGQHDADGLKNAGVVVAAGSAVATGAAFAMETVAVTTTITGTASLLGGAITIGGSVGAFLTAHGIATATVVTTATFFSLPLFLAIALPAICSPCGQYENLNAYHSRTLLCSPCYRPRSCCQPPSNCHHSNNALCCCRNPTPTPTRCHSYHTARSRSAFSALQGVSYFRCYTNTTPLHRGYRFLHK